MEVIKRKQNKKTKAAQNGTVALPTEPAVPPKYLSITPQNRFAKTRLRGVRASAIGA